MIARRRQEYRSLNYYHLHGIRKEISFGPFLEKRLIQTDNNSQDIVKNQFSH